MPPSHQYPALPVFAAHRIPDAANGSTLSDGQSTIDWYESTVLMNAHSAVPGTLASSEKKAAWMAETSLYSTSTSSRSASPDSCSKPMVRYVV